ncbi:aldo/keto reductase [Chloroflexota bacterium]
MEYLKIKPSRLGMGGEQLGIYGWHGLSEPEMERAVNKALACGVNFFDTAPIYGLGHSEELLGKALGTRRKDVIIATKVGLIWKKKGAFQRCTDASPDNIRREIDASLRRLQTDYIDLYQVHWPDFNTPIGETMMALDELKKAGKIRAIGCCNFPLDLLKEAVKYCPIAAIQSPYNLVDRGIECALLPWCRQNGIHVIAYTPIAKGLLAGQYTADTRFGPEDNRSRHPYFQDEALVENLRVVERVRIVAERLGKTSAQIALGWVLANLHIGTALVGVKNAAQMAENIGALDFALTSEDIRFLEEEIAGYA